MNDEGIIREYVYNYLKKEGTNATKIIGHLKKCLSYDEDYKALEDYLKSLTKENGERKYQDKSVKDIIKEYRAYNDYRKEELKLNNNEDMIAPQEQQTVIEAETTEMPLEISINQEAKSEELKTVDTKSNFETSKGEGTPPAYTAEKSEGNNTRHRTETSKVGRPVTNGRTEKVSFYLTKETKQQLEALKMYDGIELQDLLNEAIQVYFETRADDMKFLKEQEKAREERKRRLNKSN